MQFFVGSGPGNRLMINRSLFLLFLMMPSMASADLVIDNFAGPNQQLVEQPSFTNLDDNVVGRRTLKTDNQTDIVGSNQLKYTNGGNRPFDLTYALNTTVSLVNQVLRFSYEYDVPGIGNDNVEVVFSLLNGSGTITESSSALVTVSNGSVQTVSYAGNNFTATSANRFRVAVRRLTPATPDATITLRNFTLGGVAAVPEPGTFVLVGLSVVAGWVVKRRRKQAVEVCKE